MSRPNTPIYKTLSWRAYDKALKRRGSLTIWFDPEMSCAARPTGKRWRQPVYSDAAIRTRLTMKILFGMALRQTTRFAESLLRLIGLDWNVPDFSTLIVAWAADYNTERPHSALEYLTPADYARTLTTAIARPAARDESTARRAIAQPAPTGVNTNRAPVAAG